MGENKPIDYFITPNLRKVFKLLFTEFKNDITLNTLINVINADFTNDQKLKYLEMINMSDDITEQCDDVKRYFKEWIKFPEGQTEI